MPATHEHRALPELPCVDSFDGHGRHSGAALLASGIKVSGGQGVQASLLTMDFVDPGAHSTHTPPERYHPG